MVEVSNYGSNIALKNVNVVISAKGRIYIDYPDATRCDQYLLFETEEMSEEELDWIEKEFEKWNSESEQNAECNSELNY